MNFLRKAINSVKGKGIAALAALAVVAFGAVGAPSPASAQWIVNDPIVAAQLGYSNAKATTQDILVESAVIALVNGVNYFTSQLAYSAAVALTSDCPGQMPCWNSKEFGSGFRQAWQGAIGESIGTLSDQTGLTELGFNLCDPGVNFTLLIQLGKLDELKPPPPRCEFNKIVNNWDDFLSVSSNEEVLQGLLPTFQPGQAPLAVSLGVLDGLVDVRAEAERKEVMERIMDASAGGGFTSVRDPITGRVKAPASVVKAEFDYMRRVQQEAPGEYTADIAAGQIASKAVTSVVVNAVQTFTQTLVARLFNKLANGLLSTQELVALQPDLVLNPEGLLTAPGVTGVTATGQSRYAIAAPRDTGTIDMVLDFTSCPSADRKSNNCVMDQQFASAVRVADSTPITVRVAMERGLLHGDWPLYPATNLVKDQDPFCYTYGYCESNLRKLRAARILPVGWELAAAKANTNGSTTLKEVVDGFNDCNSRGEPDVAHRWCHLIDPDWVLKAPPAQCRALAYGATPVASNLASRAEQCVDTQTCLKQDDSGACIGGWGYCAAERNVWRFNGDTCPAAFNTCRTLTTRTGNPVSYLLNTVERGICNADNAGCAQYSLARNVTGNSIVGGPSPADDWVASSSRFLNRYAQTCDPASDGCTALYRMSATQSLNMIRNGSFEESEDNDNDLRADGPKYWTPTGMVPDGRGGALRRDGARSVHGSNAMLLPTRNVTETCTAATACNSEQGCQCVLSSGGIAGFACKIVKGQTSCPVSSMVVQDDLMIRANTTYTLSYSLIPNNAGGSVTGTGLVFFQDANGAAVSLAAADLVTTTATTAGTATCTVDAGNLNFTVTGTPANGATSIRALCTFAVSRPVSSAALRVQAGSGLNYMDAVQLEEGGGTEFHEGYGSVASAAPVSVKVAPAYLGCTGSAGDRPECANYAGVCRAEEVGCDRFSPTNGDPSVPAIAGTQDRCPTQCVGYDVFKQEASTFDQARFPEYFIPSTARMCDAASVGCSEFTNVENEQRGYYSALRLCVRPDDSTARTFYSWEGSDTTGYQLRTWSLKATTNAANAVAVVSPGASDVAASGTPTDVGPAPCTMLDGTATACASRSQAFASGSISGFCTRADIDAGNFDCREFYDDAGNRHYRLLSKTIVASASCSQHRITESTQADCAASGGRWDAARSQCIYSFDVAQSTSCPASYNGCRAYKGNAAANVRTVVIEDFESGLTGWTAANDVGQADFEVSSESITVGGHSLKLKFGNGRQARLDLTGRVAPQRSYNLSFWARGTGSVDVAFAAGAGAPAPVSAIAGPTGSLNFSDQDGATIAPRVALTSDWKRFDLGPVIVAAPASGQQPWGTAPARLRFSLSGSTNDVYIDSVELREVQDSIFVVRNSWNTPAACDQTLSGVPSPQEMLGCRAYNSQNTGGTVALRSFTNLCREQAIGCSAFSHTQNTVQNPYPQTFNAVCRLSSACTSPNAGSTCTCNYAVNHTGFAGSALKPVLYDVCRVAVGQTECRFNLEGIDDSTPQSSHPDRVLVPADNRVFLVAADSKLCDPSQVSCKAVGRAHVAYEQVCTLPGGGTGTCTINGNSCTINSGETSCTIRLEQGTIDRWDTVYLKDDPSTYTRTLCNQEAMSCEEYTAADGTYHFKSPGEKLCEYRTGVNYNGSVVSGYFRKSESGALFPCEPTLLRDGTFYEMRRNGDAEYEGWVGQCQPQYDRCEEFRDPAHTTAANPAGEPYYYIVNSKLDLASCAGKASLSQGCVLFNQTSNTQRLFAAQATYDRSEAEAFGGPVAPLNCNGAGASGLCNGATNDANVILKVRQDRECAEWLACRTYDQVYDPAVGKYRPRCTDFTMCSGTSSGTAAQTGCSQPVQPPTEVFTSNNYARRDVTWSGLEYSGYTVPERYPAQYLEPVSIVGGLCHVTSCPGGASSCVVNAYLACSSDSDCPDSLRPAGGYCKQMTGICKGNNEGRSCDENAHCGSGGYCSKNYFDTHRFGVVLDQSYSCDSNADCSAANADQSTDGTCVQNKCYYNYDGGPFSEDRSANAAQCRAYPEEDSPYGASVVNADGGGIELLSGYDAKTYQAVSKDTGYTNVNTCTYMNDCECSYKRVQYGQGGGVVRFLGQYGTAVLPMSVEGGETDQIRNYGVCSGGPRDGWTCRVAEASADCTVGTDVGSCLRPTRVTTVLGWQGFCIDQDKSLTINGATDQFACNLWLPVDQLAGAPDNFNQYREAGYQPDMEELLYCSVAQGNRGGTSSYVYTGNMSLQTNGGDNHARATLDLSANGWGKDQIAGAAIEFPNDANNRGITTKMFLTPEEGWENSFSYQSANDDGDDRIFDGGSNGTRLGLALGVGSDPQDCDEFLDREDDQTEDGCLNIGANCFAGRLNFNGNALQSAQSTVCNKDNASGNQPLTVRLRIFFREACSEVVQAYNSGSSSMNSFAWTDRLWDARNGRSTSFLPSSFVFRDIVGGPTTNPKEVLPFGPISPPMSALVLSGNNRTLPVRYPVPVYSGEGGSAFTRARIGSDPSISVAGGSPPCISPTTVISETPASSSPVYTTYCDNGYTLVAGDPGYDGDPNAPQSEQFWPASGVPYACVGECGNPDSSNKGSSARQVADDRLSQIFVRTFARYVWDANDTAGRGQPSYVRQEGYDRRGQYAAPAFKPRIVAPLTGNCDATIEGLCEESGAEGFVVAGVTDADEFGGVLQALGGRTEATFKYYAWADSNHMPIRRRLVDFGDGTVIGAGNEGWFRNHRGCPAGGGPCKADNQICRANSDDWGRTMQACESRYFQDTHLYTCTAEQVRTLTRCTTGDGNNNAVYPCSDGTSCVYKPRIQVMDNWGVCNGNCNGGQGTGDVCFNEASDLALTSTATTPASSGTRNECVSLKRSNWIVNSGSGTPNIRPWTEFPGVIKVRPN